VKSEGFTGTISGVVLPLVPLENHDTKRQPLHVFTVWPTVLGALVQLACEVARMTKSSKHIVFAKTRTVQKLLDGDEELFYEAVIDLQDLDWLARKAAKNKKGVAIDGPLCVRIIERRKRKL
jgi:hypothetical protein